MGPLWAWVILWLVSAYGLVLLLRSVMARAVVEAVPVLVATPTPAEPAATEAPEQADPPEETGPTAGPGEETPAIETLDEGGTGEESLEPELPSEASAGPEVIASPPDPEAPSAEAPVDEEPAIASEPWVEEQEGLEASEPWIKEKEVHEAGEPWIGEQEVAAGLSHDGDEANASEADSVSSSDEEEPVVYRTIALDSLTLGLEATEIQELYGSPGHMSKVGEDGEQWRYPLNASDDRGEGVEGVLVLEFQRGRLVSKALEESEAPKDA